MNGYDFTRFSADFTATLKAKKFYDVDELANKITESNPGVDFRQNADYKDAEHWFIETTMSCDKDEAVDWMKYYMANAIAYGIQTKSLDWRTKFLAAHDLFVSLTGGRVAMSNRQARFLQNC